MRYIEPLDEGTVVKDENGRKYIRTCDGTGNTDKSHPWMMYHHGRTTEAEGTEFSWREISEKSRLVEADVVAEPADKGKVTLPDTGVRVQMDLFNAEGGVGASLHFEIPLDEIHLLPEIRRRAMTGVEEAEKA